MTPERWQQIDQLFHEALAFEPGQRCAFLDSACAEDESLRLEVGSLISAHEDGQSFIETPAGDVAAELLGSYKSRIEPGKRIGNYNIVRQVGSGGMGEVYLAVDTKLGRKVALKLLPEVFTKDVNRVRRFEQEARAASALNHPNIVTIHEIGETDSLHFIATEFIEGETLREHMPNRRVTIGEVLDLAAQIASALQAAHEAGIVHRDIKPENIMLRRDSIVKVLDFGLAKLTPNQALSVDPEAQTKRFVRTNPGVVMGTVGYMSPEQARGQEVDAGTDLWSLGVVLYEMLTGRVPFTGETSSHLIVSILEDEPPPLRHYIEAPDELERVVSKALSKKRHERYQTASEMAFELKELRQELEMEVRLKRVAQPGTNRPQNQPSKATTADVAMHSTTSGEYLRGKLHTGLPSSSSHAMATMKRRSLRGTLLAGIILAGLIGAGIYSWSSMKLKPQASNLTIKSIAVLPLKNLSGDSTQEYLADGMTEALINELAKIGALRLISRTSIMQYKQAPKTVSDIASELNVDAVVEGAVLRSNNRVRITAQLIRAKTDELLWAGSYERDVRDVLALQSDIARGIAGEIRIKLTPQEESRLASVRPTDPAAHEAYLKGLYSRNQAIDTLQTNEFERLLKESIEYFEQSIKLDPNYALAYSAMAGSYHWLSSGGFPEFYPKAKEAALKALALDDTLAEAHGALAFTIWRHDWDFAGAESEFKKCGELAPNCYIWAYAQFLSSIGRHDEAIRKIKTAQDHDPRTLLLKSNIGFIYLDARKFDDAIAQYRSVLGLDPKQFEAQSGLGIAYVLKGMHDEGIAECRKAFDLSGEMPQRANLAWALAMAGRRSEAIKILDDLKDPSKRESHLRLAMIYSALGEKDLGMSHLEKGYAKRSEGLLWLKVNPTFDGLRSDPRFADLIGRIGFPQ